MKTSPEKNKEPHVISSPVKVTVAYLVMGGLWISFVHRGLSFVFSDRTAHAILDLSEGWFFISVTALILYWLVVRDIAVN